MLIIKKDFNAAHPDFGYPGSSPEQVKLLEDHVEDLEQRLEEAKSNYEILDVARGHDYRIRTGAARRTAGWSSASLCQAPLPAAAAGSVERAERRLATAVRDSACAVYERTPRSAPRPPASESRVSGRQALSKAWKWFPRPLKSRTRCCPCNHAAHGGAQPFPRSS
ncbi:hypothetical protein MRX96_039717 [Rhipicephalus microplus]